METSIVLVGTAALILYAYFGYPILVWMLGRFSSSKQLETLDLPRVSFIITARNEERDLPRKLLSTLALDYPRDKLEVIVASDASTDQTDAIVRDFAHRGVILCEQRFRKGKTFAQRCAAERATGDILVMSDATSDCEPDAIRRLVAPFSDPTVGCVAGRLVYRSQGRLVGSECVRYWNYETLLRQWESRVNSLVGVSGCLYAIRRSCFPRLSPDLIDDFAVAAEMRLRHLRTVFEPMAVCTEDTHEASGAEFQMRVRVVEQTLRTLWAYVPLLNPFQHGFYAVQVFSHKVLRYAVAPLLVLLLAGSVRAAILGSSWALVLAGVQVGAHGTGLVGLLYPRLATRLRLTAFSYLLLGNLAILVALWHVASGRRHVVWEPIRPPGPRDEAPAPRQ